MAYLLTSACMGLSETFITAKGPHAVANVEDRKKKITCPHKNSHVSGSYIPHIVSRNLTNLVGIKCPLHCNCRQSLLTRVRTLLGMGMGQDKMTSWGPTALKSFPSGCTSAALT